MGKAEELTWHKAWTAVSSGFSISYTSRIFNGISNIWPDNNAQGLIPAGYVKVVPTHNLPVFSCVPQAQYINSLASK
ncbi:hypothetical protein OU622_23300, partial [Escherichia coli]|nr:hypothetical protein [Escherichia coli]